jgi:hypothetical protein
MKLHSKRIVRTLQSEQYSIFDLDRLEDGVPVSLGKLDLHYTAEGTYGTLLLWRKQVATVDDNSFRALVQEILDEYSAPMGVPGEFLIECILADEQDYKVFTNMTGETAEAEDATAEA